MVADRVWWCGRGCGAELLKLAEDGACPRCGHSVEDLGWRWYGSRHQPHYASSVATLPKEERP